MPANTSPIYPLTINNTVNTATNPSSTEVTLATGGTNGSVVTALHYYQSAAQAVTCTLRTQIGATKIDLAKWTTAATADLTENILRSARLPFIDDANPAFPLENGQTILLLMTGSSTTVTVTTLAGDF